MIDDEVAKLACSWIGTPYHNMAAVKGAGCDCIGLVRGVWAELNNQPLPPVPVYSARWTGRNKDEELLLDTARAYLQEVEASARGPGVVLAFRVHPNAVAQHCGIMTTEKTMVHAHSGRKVYEVELGAMWEPKIVAAFRFPEKGD